MCPVQSPSDVMNLVLLNEKHHAYGPTTMYDGGSRSQNMSGCCSCMHLVDLAGSERVASQKHRGRLKEAGYINKSLSCLGDVITLRRILTLLTEIENVPNCCIVA